MSDSAPSAATSAPSDFTRRTLRLWAIFEVIYGPLLILAVALLVPWKSPGWNAALIGYAAIHIAAAPGLWRLRVWGWRLALAGGLVGLALVVVVCTGLLASWAYLRAIYGDFGRGASIGALLFASVGLQVLGLYPALLLRAMLRREVRADVGVGRHWLKVILGLCLLPLMAALWTGARYDMETVEPVGSEGRRQAITYVRAALEGSARPALEALEGVPVGEGPLYVTLWDQGQIRDRVTGNGADMAEAVRNAADELAASFDLEWLDGRRGRLKVDRSVGAAPLLGEVPLVVALSVDPGLDGLRRGRFAVLPDDLVHRQLFGAASPVPGIRELRLGLATEQVLREVRSGDAALERLRTESWVEFEGTALEVVRGNTPAPGRGPEAWRRAAIAGGDFILRQIMDDGRFHYQYFPLSGIHPPAELSGYSLARHAGTVYALSLLHGHTDLPRFRLGAERAIAWLAGHIPPSCGGPERGCVIDGQWASLGATALTMVGMLEYQRQTGDKRYAPLVERLAEFVLMLQKPDGDFFHMYDPHADQVDEGARSMFYSEEAALALVIAHEVLGEARYLEAARRALDFLTGPKYEAFFLGRFIYGADHWTCIAAEEAWPRLQDPQYLDFCLGYARFIRRLQYEPGDCPPGFEGHYGFGTVMVPQAPAASGFTEAVISTWELSVHHGETDPALAEQVAAGLDALARDQIRPENAWMMPDPEAAAGGFRRSLVEQEIRIDFTQHAASALIRGADMIRPDGLGAP